jgi:hypothetical protein
VTARAPRYTRHAETNDNDDVLVAQLRASTATGGRGLLGVAPFGLPVSVAMAAPLDTRLPKSLAVQMRRMRIAVEPFVGNDAAAEATNTVGSILAIEPHCDHADVMALALSSLRRLQGGEAIRGGRQIVVGHEVDCLAAAQAMADAWRSAS